MFFYTLLDDESFESKHVAVNRFYFLFVLTDFKTKEVPNAQ